MYTHRCKSLIYAVNTGRYIKRWSRQEVCCSALLALVHTLTLCLLLA
jgi:hypothetical protein